MKPPTLTMISPDSLQASKTNPREHFGEAELAELAAGMVAQGVEQLTPLTVRPLRGAVGRFEIVCGERRWRAGQLAKVAGLPCVVRDLSDLEAIELQWVENLQREDLKPMELARGYAAMLALKDTAGRPRYTRASLAARFGFKTDRSIGDALSLLALPAPASVAVDAGELDQRLGARIGRIPDAAARAKAAGEILAQKMPRAQAEAHIRDNYTVSLVGCPFALDDAALLPAAGACSVCPKMTDNQTEGLTREEVERQKRRKLCTDPTCHRAKLAAQHGRQSAEAVKAGKRLLGAAESERVYPRHQPAGEMDYSSTYVDLGRKPDPYLLKREVKVGETWGALVGRAEGKTGGKVPRVMIRDQQGVLHECAELAVAKAAIEQAGEPIFATKEAVEPRPPTPAAKLTAEQKAGQKALRAQQAENRKLVDAAEAAALEGLRNLPKGSIRPLWHLLDAVLSDQLKTYVGASAKALGLRVRGSDLDAVMALGVVGAQMLTVACMVKGKAAEARRDGAAVPELLTALAPPPPAKPAGKRADAAKKTSKPKAKK